MLAYKCILFYKNYVHSKDLNTDESISWWVNLDEEVVSTTVH